MLGVPEVAGAVRFSVEQSWAYGACVDEFRQSSKGLAEACELLRLMLVGARHVQLRGVHEVRHVALSAVAGRAVDRHGYENICQTITNIEFGGMADLTEEMQVKLRSLGRNRAGCRTSELVPESWREINVSEDGLAAQVTSPATELGEVARCWRWAMPPIASAN
ncbi:MAG: hypothetical protein AB1513_00035 [Pseudomonadota bacterium]